MSRFEFESGTFQWFLHLSLFRVENHGCLSHGVQVASVT
jgi:hypothetical protein